MKKYVIAATIALAIKGFIHTLNEIMLYLNLNPIFTVEMFLLVMVIALLIDVVDLKIEKE